MIFVARGEEPRSLRRNRTVVGLDRDDLRQDRSSVCRLLLALAAQPGADELLREACGPSGEYAAFARTLVGRGGGQDR